MAKYVFIKSYAHAEAMGIKPVDSIIGTVIQFKKKPPYKIVGMIRGHTLIRPTQYKLASMKTYIVKVGGGEVIIYAIIPTIAKMIARTTYYPPFKIFEQKTTYRKV